MTSGNHDSQLQELDDRLDRLRDEVTEIKTTARIVGTILGVAGLAGIGTLIVQANQKVSTTVNQAIEDQVPRMVEAQINENFPDLGASTQKINEALARADDIISSAEDIQTSQPLRDKVEKLGTEYSKCEWVEIGYAKSHGDDESEWCTVGSFIAQVDLGADESRPAGSSPTISRALCCAP